MKGEPLRRRSSQGIHYARFKSGSKEIRRDLGVTDQDGAEGASSGIGRLPCLFHRLRFRQLPLRIRIAGIEL